MQINVTATGTNKLFTYLSSKIVEPYSTYETRTITMKTTWLHTYPSVVTNARPFLYESNTDTVMYNSDYAVHTSKSFLVFKSNAMIWKFDLQVGSKLVLDTVILLIVFFKTSDLEKNTLNQ